MHWDSESEYWSEEMKSVRLAFEVFIGGSDGLQLPIVDHPLLATQCSGEIQVMGL